ncbi:hypothetical protein A9264_15125 [Vibrio sp. UCD-FRSSP16_10]|uniref:MBL fold metallo-hydrolase n=1 Tax=unclassified Vibrio TaxID=2614977 RepID=UPI0007FBC4E9|nr:MULTISPECIES: MBL fold metallo-hydrolase [unclassified Vibrio]OBT13010.1 hypothetical protein A9260_15285 [Vibrio sp. UCD-FRSSP16_30]OBT19253.1 hypothetical protein A9264_15125 [Vibrio sp. UCD-FRSSP16_10]
MAFPTKKILLLAVCSLTSLSYAQASPMVATIIGSGSPDYNPERVSAGVLITQGDTQVLVDMGDGVNRNLKKFGVDARKIDALLFTHHHLDHNADFSSLLTGVLMGRSDVLIAGPTQTKDFTNSNLSLYEQDLNYRLGKSKRSLDQRKKHLTVTDLKGGDSFKIDDIKVSTLSVPHTIETIAFRFDYKDQSVVISGDLSSGPGFAEFSKDANCLIMDSGGMVMKNGKKKKDKKKGKKSTKQRAHLNLDDSSKLAGDANVDKLVYTHFVRGKIDEEASKEVITKNYNGEIIFSTDLMSLDCGNTAQTK